MNNLYKMPRICAIPENATNMNLQYLLASTFALVIYACNSGTGVKSCGANKPNEDVPTDSFRIEIDQSLIYWSGSSPSGSHNGLVKLAGGELYFKEDILIGGEIRIDMRSIENLDIEDSSDRKDLEDHLREVDFFNIDTFPVAKFFVKGSNPTSDTLNNIVVQGEIEIKGIRKSMVVTGNVQKTENRTFVSIPEFTIDRTDFNIMYQSKKILPSIKDGFINDDIALSINLMGIRSNSLE